MKLLSVFLFLTAFVACSGPQQKIPEHRFVTRKLPSPFDTTVNFIADYKGYIFCEQSDSTVAILDTNYNRQPALEAKINSKKIDYIGKYHDTLFFSIAKKNYYLSDAFELRGYTGNVKYNVLYEDDLYQVTSCCLGEFGGSIYFLHKPSNKVFAQPISCVSQVMHSKSGYFVGRNLAHLMYSTGYFIFKDPQQLYQLADSQLNKCDWSFDVEFPDYRKTGPPKHIQWWKSLQGTMTAMSFYRDDSLYALVSSEGATMLGIMRDSAIVVKDTIFQHGLNFHETQVIKSGSRYVGLLRLTGGSPVAAYFVTGNASALIVVNGENIDMMFGTKKSR